MAAAAQPDMTARWRGRFRSRKLLVAVCAVVMLLLVAFAKLTPLAALLALAALLVAALGLPLRDNVLPQPSRGRTSVGWRDLVAAVPDPLVILDSEQRVVAANAAAQALAPTLREGESFALALRVPDVLAALRQSLGTGEQTAVRYQDRVPTERWFEVIFVPVGSAPQNPVRHIAATFHDLTPLHRVEEMRADFVANASHELRTPLAAVLGFIDTLQGPARNDGAARERFLSIMRGQAARMARLIDDLLSLSRVELSEHRHPDTPVDLVSVARQVAEGLESLARERGVEIVTALPQALRLVLGDRDELLRATENLVENAVKYGASGKRIEVALTESAEANGLEYSLTVRDFGPGISAEHLPRLTERFYRVDVADSRAQGGTGLGLALVKHVLNRHRGRLSITSTPGQGASFIMHLPAAEQSQK